MPRRAIDCCIVPQYTSEYGDCDLLVTDDVWRFDKVFGYRHFTSCAQLLEAYQSLIDDQLKPLIHKGLSAAVYTQATDVEQETNGVVTYGRRVIKFDEAAFRRINESVWRSPRAHG